MTRRGKRKRKKLWIAGALEHPAGEKSPAARVEAATHADSPTLLRRARLAKTLAALRR